MITDYIQMMINLLVPDKRTPNTIAFLSPISNQLQINNDTLFTVYKQGMNFLDFNPSTTYTRYSVVKYGKAVYYSADDDNTGNFPYVGSEFWVQITNNFIGMDQRIHFNGTKLVFEYAINTFFGTYYEPNTNLNSEIYLETTPTIQEEFRIGDTESFSSSVLNTTSTGYIKLTDIPSNATSLTIWVKDLNTSGKPTYDEIKHFADKYIIAGIRYKISSY